MLQWSDVPALFRKDNYTWGNQALEFAPKINFGVMDCLSFRTFSKSNFHYSKFVIIIEQQRVLRLGKHRCSKIQQCLLRTHPGTWPTKWTEGQIKVFFWKLQNQTEAHICPEGHSFKPYGKMDLMSPTQPHRTWLLWVSLGKCLNHSLGF